MTHSAQRALQALGIHLSDPLPLFIMAGLATDRRLLLVGLPGQAKTALVRALGEQLTPGRTRVLNAALTNFDDVRGFVRPASLDAGKAEIVPGPWSPYDDELLFVDELSRAPAAQQNRWLQLIHERLVDGLPTRLRWVIAAMNPPSVDGTFPLGLATVDRFHAVLELDEFGTLDAALQISIAAGLVASTEARVDLGEHLAKIRARADLIAADPARRFLLARVTIAALEAFRRAGGPFAPQGRRAVFLTELLASLVAALEVEHGAEAPHLLGDYLDAWINAGLTALGRAAELDPAALASAHEAAWGAATRAWTEVFEGRGRRAELTSAAPTKAREGRDGLAAIVSAELKRPSLDADAFTRVATELWCTRKPPGLEAQPASAIQFLCESVLDVEGAEVPVSDKLVHIGDTRVYIDLSGNIHVDPEQSVLDRFAAASSTSGTRDTTVWPVPYAPIAVIVPGDRPDEPALAAAAMRLLRPAYCLSSVRASFPYQSLVGVPVIASSAVHDAMTSRTRGGVFHPERPARDGSPARKPLIVFGVPHRAWRDLAELVRSGP